MFEQHIDNVQQLCEAFPFLSALPSPLLDHLDLSEFYWPSAALTQSCVHLEALLRAYIVTYRSTAGVLPQPGTYHLCRLLVPAQLASPQLAWLEHAEQAIQRFEVRLVAYRKPLQLRNEQVAMLW